MIEYVQMNADHIKQITQLEQLCFSSPWSEFAFLSELKNPLSTWIVAVDGDIVAGYVGAQSVMDEADMMNLAVYPDYRRQKIGSALVERLICQLQEQQVQALTLEVRASNEGAIALYERMGFGQIGRRPGYYTKPREDALILKKEWDR